MSESKALGGAELSLTNRSKRRWWQRMFLYPTVVGAIIGAIPTGLDYYKAFVYDIEFGEVKHAEEQRRLWVKNFACAQNISYQQVKTSENILVQVGACPNGDVLIEVAPPNGQRIVEWISLDKLKTASAVSSLSLVGQAYAAALTLPYPAHDAPRSSMPAKAGAVIKCQRMEGQTQIIRIIQEGNACFREVIEVMKGKVVQRSPVPCTTSCN